MFRKKNVICLLFLVFLLLPYSFSKTLSQTSRNQDQSVASAPKNQEENLKNVLEEFLLGKNRMIMTETYDFGRIDTYIQIDALIITPLEPKEDLKMSIKFSLFGQGYGPPTVIVNIIEIDSVIKAIDFLILKAESWKKEDFNGETKLFFSTKSNFKVGFVQKGKSQSAFVNFDNAISHFDISELSKLRTKITSARDFMSSRY